MELAELQRCFPVNVPILNELSALLEFQNRARKWYSGHFELDKWPYSEPAWFDGDRGAAEQFSVFGRERDGSLYALWHYPGLTVAGAPVVFLGSEGTDCGLVANDLRGFHSLLAIGAHEVGFAIAHGEIAEEVSAAARLDEFRDWLRESFGIEPPADPMAIVMAARSQHPDFGNWLSSWQKEHFRS